MSIVDLKPLFDALAVPGPSTTDSIAVSATAIPGFQTHRVAKDEYGSAGLLISTAGPPVSSYPVRLENLSVEHGVRCRIWQGGEVVEEGTFTVLLCPAPDPLVRDYFLKVSGPFLAVLGEVPTNQQVSDLVNSLVKLFQALSEPPRRSVQGLWAELFLVARARDPRAMMKAWHADPGERYDFGAGSQRIEVKSAVGRPRVHHFSLEQLCPPAMTILLIASVCTERSGGGTSLGDLLAALRKRLTGDPNGLLRLESVVSATLGESLMGAMDQAYDLQLATQSLRYFEVNSIPKPEGTMPREVSDVRFVADLTQIEPVDLTLFSGARGLFEAALPA